MLTLEARTTRSQSEVAQRLREFFGPGGLGLAVSESGDAMVFEGAGGFVRASIRPSFQEHGQTVVDLHTREFEGQVEKFAREL
jgi:hypothetical protein